MKTFSFLGSLLLILCLSIPERVFCQHKDDCKELVNLGRRNAAYLSQRFTDTFTSGDLRITLSSKPGTGIYLTISAEIDNYYELEAKDSLGRINYVSPYELQEGMDTYLQFASGTGFTIDGKETLKNREAIYRRQAEESLISRHPPTEFTLIKPAVLILTYKVVLNNDLLTLLQKKKLKTLSVPGTYYRFILTEDTADKLQKVIKCLSADLDAKK